MKAKILLMVLMVFLLGATSQAKKKEKAKTNWENVDFMDAYKIKVKIPGGVAKSLKNNKTFINNYSVGQALRMKGSEGTATKTLFSEVSFGGVSQSDFQAMVDELYQDFVSDLTAAGLNVTNGDEIVAGSYAQKKKADNKSWIGKVGKDPVPTKAGIMDGVILGYGVWGVKDGVDFRPTDSNVFLTSKKIYGNFYGNLISSENVNLISVAYYVTFAAFDGGKGYKDIKLATKPALSINPVVYISTPKGTSTITVGKGPFWGNSGWSAGIVETDSHDGAFWGISSKAKYSIDVKPELYLGEIKAITKNFQKDLVQVIKESF